MLTAAAALAPARRRPAGNALPPAVVVGGAVNALSVARCLGRRGIKVYAINPPGDYICYSRYCTWVADAGTNDAEIADYLLGPRSDWLRGAVLLACNDATLQLIAYNRKEMEKKFLLDESNPAAQLCMLDKLCTYRAAVAAGVPTPRFWVPQGEAALRTLEGELLYPLLVKPLLSHEYRKVFTKKFATAQSFGDVLSAFRAAQDARVAVMLVEKIPGPDDRLCSYYTYLDADGNALFDFTKRIIRRYPVTSGFGCYHITDHVPELREPSLRLFRHVGLRGLANVEFKLDERDGKLKLIECNARFTGGNGLVAAAGYDLASFVYNRIVGLPQKPFGAYKLGKRLWYPVEDFLAYRQLRAQGQITFGQWLASVAHPSTLPYFAWSDPRPSLLHEARRLRDMIARRVRRLFSGAACP